MNQRSFIFIDGEIFHIVRESGDKRFPVMIKTTFLMLQKKAREEIIRSYNENQTLIGMIYRELSPGK